MDAEPYQIHPRIRLIRLIIRPLFRGLFHLLSRVRIYGKENIPERGPYLIAINHISLYEPPFVLAFWPAPAEAAGAVDIWDRSGQSTLVRMYGGIPLRRGEYDRKAIETILRVLKSGHPLMLAPEGGRSHTLGLIRAFPGIAYLADAAQVPVVPVGIVGTSDDFLNLSLMRRRPTLEMHIGKPFLLPEISGRGELRRKSRQDNADLIMKKIAELLPPEYHGVYTGEMTTGSPVSNK